MKKGKNCVDITNFEGKIYDKQKNIGTTWLDRKKIERQRIYSFVKRMIDIIIGCLGIIFIFPVIVWIAYRIHKDDPNSPVVFKQKRVGRNGKVFTMYKFRSMCTNAEEQLKSLLDKNEIEGAMFKIKEDPRITEFGKFIRRTSLDELPQLFNVIKGDMSLIGPRPPLQLEVEKYTEYDMQRLFVKPGCSGLWQVSGRNNVHFDDMVNLDIEYIQRRSTKYDLSLIVRTIKVILKAEGAY
ncbi:sugar transferase [Enterococcus pseudoavium]|uniref:sugar transferase n=1 Tax=Enterococcus pseudoavium TaxID=44007 RepID=UPI000831BC7D|nr:sugar transferase [Enterococcus pseudoavium]REC32395.1 sugar transferase [Enterococcus pseudoavium]